MIATWSASLIALSLAACGSSTPGARRALRRVARVDAMDTWNSSKLFLDQARCQHLVHPAHLDVFVVSSPSTIALSRRHTRVPSIERRFIRRLDARVTMAYSPR